MNLRRELRAGDFLTGVAFYRTRALEGLTMICTPCGEQQHADCPGKNRCDCQHRPVEKTEPKTSTPAP